jgi:hypothetical protein
MGARNNMVMQLQLIAKPKVCVEQMINPARQLVRTNTVNNRIDHPTETILSSVLIRLPRILNETSNHLYIAIPNMTLSPPFSKLKIK